MEEKYHISPSTGNPNRCYAKKRCPLGAAAEEHYPSKAEARAAYEASHGRATLAPAAKKKTPVAPSPEEQAPSLADSGAEGLQEVAGVADDDFSDIKCDGCGVPLSRCVCGECAYCGTYEGDDHDSDCPKAKPQAFRYSWEIS